MISRDIRSGLRAGVPIMLGFFPVAVSFAIIGRQAGLNTFQIGLMSLTVFAGASQIMAAGMLIQGAGFIAIVVATFLLNLRHIIMSTCVFERMEPSRKTLRLWAAYYVTDESFAVFTTGQIEHRSVWFFLSMGLATYVAWFTGSVLGSILTDFLPVILSDSLGIALYALFVALLVPNLSGNGRLALLVLMTAVFNTLFGQIMAQSWSLIMSTLLCALIGVYFVDMEEDEQHE